MAKYPKRWDDAVPARVTLHFGSWRGLQILPSTSDRSGWVQKPQTGSPNAYVSVRSSVPNPPVGRMSADTCTLAPRIAPGGQFRFYQNKAHNEAYNKLKAKAHSCKTANLALLAVDHRSAAVMIATRGSQLLEAIRAAKKADVYGVAVALGAVSAWKKQGPRRPEDKRVIPHTGSRASGLWLEFNFGWAPLFDDIYTASKVLSESTIPATVVGKGINNFSVSNQYIDDVRRRQSYEGFVGCRMQATVRVTNPNLLLFNQLGLVNPAYVLWDAVPFSFVADWFLPVGRYLQSYTDWVGLHLDDPMTTYHWRGMETGPDAYDAAYQCSYTTRRTDRILGVPSLNFPAEARLSDGDLWKAVTSAALIIQQITPALKGLTRGDLSQDTD